MGTITIMVRRGKINALSDVFSHNGGGRLPTAPLRMEDCLPDYVASYASLLDAIICKKKERESRRQGPGPFQ